MTIWEILFAVTGFVTGFTLMASWQLRRRSYELLAQSIVDMGHDDNCQYCAAKDRIAVKAGATSCKQYEVFQEGGSRFKVIDEPPLSEEEDV